MEKQNYRTENEFEFAIVSVEIWDVIRHPKLQNTYWATNLGSALPGLDGKAELRYRKRVWIRYCFREDLGLN